MSRYMILLLSLVGCGAMDLSAPTSQPEAMDEEADYRSDDEWGDMGGAGGPPPRPSPAPEGAAAPKRARASGGMTEPFAAVKKADGVGVLTEDESGEPAPGDQDRAAGEPARTRSWFPETFLWEPSIETGSNGVAKIEVTVPDRLTDWRVLALANSRDGGLAGGVTSFKSTLPVYVDPVVPPFLLQGDRVRLPVQVVNTTSLPQQARLDIRASGAATVSTTGAVSLPPGATRVVWTDVPAPRSGTVTLEVALAGADTVQRRFEVMPSGRPLTLNRGGTLAAPRDLQLMGPLGMDPDSARLRLAVYPGALAVLRQELSAAGDRGGLQGTAYALLLSGEGPALLERLGQPVSADGPDPDARAIAANLRRLRIQATARAASLARTPSLAPLLSLAAPALSHPTDPLLARMGDRLLQQLAQQQLPDGTFGGSGDGRWTVQRLMVATAQAARAANDAAATTGTPAEVESRQRIASRIGLQASAAFERYAAQITDGYTAAAVLASGAASPELSVVLEKTLLDSIEDQPDGTRLVPVYTDMQRFDGTRPSAIEATALAAMSLQDRVDVGIVADLGAAVLAGWRPGAGWGDGATDLVALQAVVALFSDPLPESVTIALSRDGVVVAERELDAAALRDLAIIDVPAVGAEGPHTWSVSATPAVPGLGFDLALKAWVPWPAVTPDAGLELAVQVPTNLALGKRSNLVIVAAAPAGRSLVLDQRLPAGVQVDEEALSELVIGGPLSGFVVEDGRLHLEIRAVKAAQTARLVVPVTPTLSGTLHAGAATLSIQGRDDLSITQPPVAWLIGG